MLYYDVSRDTYAGRVGIYVKDKFEVTVNRYMIT